MRVGDARPTHFYSIYHHQVVVHAPAERADTLPLFLLYPYVYSVAQTMEEATARADLIYSGTKDGEILHRGS
jgi:hypothetical protein